MDIFEKVTERLKMLGYATADTDSTAINYNIDKTERDLKARTNQSEVPDGLFDVWVDMAAGFFLTDKKAVGALSESYDFSAAVQSVSEGDTSVTFGNASTAEEQFDAMLAKMIEPDANRIIAFRRLRW